MSNPPNFRDQKEVCFFCRHLFYDAPTKDHFCILYEKGLTPELAIKKLCNDYELNCNYRDLPTSNNNHEVL